jgi:hypothetical protein
MRRLMMPLLIALLAVAIHVDWHLARPMHHRLSLAWSQHWIVAAILFGIAGWLIARAWPDRPLRPALTIVGLAVLAAQGIEPVLEVALYQHRLGFPNDPSRWLAFAICLAAGLPALGAALWLTRPRDNAARPTGVSLKPRHFYLGLCVLGVLLPNAPFVGWVRDHGLDARLFVHDLFANGVSSFFGLDVVLSALVVCGFVLIEGRRIGLRRLWMPIVALLVVGVSLGLPLFLYQRQLRLDRASG